MKKIISVLLVLALMLSLAACSNSSVNNNGGEGPHENVGQNNQQGGENNAQPLHLVVATTTPDNTTNQTYTGQHCMYYFVEKLAEVSGGMMTAEVSWGGVLGNTAQLFSQASEGTIAMTMCGLDVLGSLKNGNDTAVFSMPYLFESYDHIHRYINSESFQTYWKTVEEANNLTLVADIGPAPCRNLNTKTPVYSVDDLDNMKIRVAESRASVAVWTAWGANPVVIPATEVYSALENNLCDGWENQISGFDSLKTVEVAPYISRIDYVFQGNVVLMNTDIYNSLTDQQKGWLKEALDYAYQHNIDESYGLGDYAEIGAEEDNKIAAMLEDPDFSGIFIPQEEIDLEGFKTKAMEVARDLEGDLFSEGLVDEILALRTGE